MLQTVNRYNFEKEVLESNRPVLVNFWINGNEDCRCMRKLMRELDQQLENNYYKIVEINWGVESELAHKYGVFGTPSLLIFSKGKLINRYSGTFNVNEFLQNSHLESKKLHSKQNDHLRNEYPNEKFDGD